MHWVACMCRSIIIKHNNAQCIKKLGCCVTSPPGNFHLIASDVQGHITTFLGACSWRLFQDGTPWQISIHPQNFPGVTSQLDNFQKSFSELTNFDIKKKSRENEFHEETRYNPEGAQSNSESNEVCPDRRSPPRWCPSWNQGRGTAAVTWSHSESSQRSCAFYKTWVRKKNTTQNIKRENTENKKLGQRQGILSLPSQLYGDAT